MKTGHVLSVLHIYVPLPLWSTVELVGGKAKFCNFYEKLVLLKIKSNVCFRKMFKILENNFFLNTKFNTGFAILCSSNPSAE